MKRISVLACATLISLGASAQVKLAADNVDEVLKAMTLEEKCELLVGKVGAGLAGLFGGDAMIGQHADLVPGAAGMTRNIDRLGIPMTVLTDGPAGVRINPTRPDTSDTFFCTGFPVGTVLACTWNQELVEEVGHSIGNEVLEYGCDVLLAPGMNIHRSPLCGRNFEYYSEDPVVTGKIAAAYVRGIQSQGVGTSIKHFAVNSQETNRSFVDEVVSQRALREIYLKGFEIAVKESNPWTVMSSYNKVNGEFSQQSHGLLTTILRDEWGYQGMVMTDWGEKEGTVKAVIAGNDLMEPGSQTEVDRIIEAAKNGTIPMADIDRNAKRMLQYIVKTPRFKGYKYSNKPDLKAHAAVTRQAATEGMVLLKNENETLPLKNVKKVAVFGLTSYDFIAGGSGSGDVNKAYTVSLMEGLNNAGLEVDQKLSDVYTHFTQYQHARANMAAPAGLPDMFKVYMYANPLFRTEPEIDVIGLANVAQNNEMAFITLGRQAGEGQDRKEVDDFILTEAERNLITNVCNAFHKVGKKVVVILNMGNVLETASWKGMPDAILLAWQPGQEGGNSVADVLTGKSTPSGKLTMTWPVNLIDVPSTTNFPGAESLVPDMMSFMGSNAPKEFTDFTRHKEGINIGYRYFNTVGKEVSYPFGFGLSYTTFAYSKPVVKPSKEGFTASITVTNTGKVAGKEVVQLYVSAPSGGLEKPAQELKAFAKTRELKPGESQTLTLNVTAYELASFNEVASQWETAVGNYTVKFAASCEDIRATAIYKQVKPYIQKVNDVLKPNMDL